MLEKIKDHIKNINHERQQYNEFKKIIAEGFDFNLKSRLLRKNKGGVGVDQFDTLQKHINQNTYNYIDSGLKLIKYPNRSRAPGYFPLF